MEYRFWWLVSLFLTVYVSKANSDIPSVFGAFFSSGNEKQIEGNSVDNTRSDVSVAENEFTALRIEYIKNQILKKLRLKEKPTVSVGNLPKPVKEYENLLPDEDINLQSSYSDDYYGKTTQAIIFPYEGKFYVKIFITASETGNIYPSKKFFDNKKTVCYNMF